MSNLSTNPLTAFFRQPKIYVSLPSKGKFYKEGTLELNQSGELAVYAMTARDELMFKTPDALMNGQATVEVIKSCVPAIKNPWSMPSIDMDTVLIAIRIATYGEKMDFTSTCPSCKSYNDLTFNLVSYLDLTANFEYDSVIRLEPLTIHIRPYTYKEVTKNAIKAIEQQNIISIVNNDALSEQEKIDEFGKSFVKLTELTVDVIAGCVRQIDTPEGSVTDPEMIKEFINNSTKETFNAINEKIMKIKDQIELKEQQAKCQECEHEYSIGITMDQTNFFAVGS